MNELKPCPFCGGEAYAAKDRYGKILIGCEKCHLHFGIEVEDGCELVDGWRATFPDVETAVTAWNERADINPEKDCEELRRTKELLENRECYIRDLEHELGYDTRIEEVQDDESL